MSTGDQNFWAQPQYRQLAELGRRMNSYAPAERNREARLWLAAQEDWACRHWDELGLPRDTLPNDPLPYIRIDPAVLPPAASPQAPRSPNAAESPTRKSLVPSPSHAEVVTPARSATASDDGGGVRELEVQ